MSIMQYYIIKSIRVYYLSNPNITKTTCSIGFKCITNSQKVWTNLLYLFLKCSKYSAVLRFQKKNQILLNGLKSP